MRMENKLGYVALEPKWGWMIGTGIYLDTLQVAKSNIDREGHTGYQRHHEPDRDHRRGGGSDRRGERLGTQSLGSAGGRSQDAGIGEAGGAVAGNGTRTGGQ